MILLVTPPSATPLHGNATTARRWAALLTELGHEVHVHDRYEAGDHDLLIALHARKSAPAVRRFRQDHPQAPVVVAFTGTDLYPSLAENGVESDVLGTTDRFVVLQRRGLDQLDGPVRSRTRVIVQSMPALPRRPTVPGCFEVAFLANARRVKDPLRLAEAVRLLPSSSRIVVSHAGSAPDPDTGAALRRAAATGRYRWLGPLPRADALELLARSSLLAVTSLSEGGANVVTEALAAGVPVISSDIPGSVGLLGEDHPGYYPAGDTAALATLLDEVETDVRGRGTALRRHCSALAGLVDPEVELRAWAELLDELDTCRRRR